MKSEKLSTGDYNKIVEAFQSESDRGAAVLACSFLENYLTKYLKGHMVKGPHIDRLFIGFGPFSDFKKRSESAYAFGLIAELQKRDLDYIGKIRNHFAHHPFKAAFDLSPVADWCENLTTKSFFPLKGQEADKRTDNRNRYLVAISLCIGVWHNKLIARSKSKASS